ncbi:phosphoglycolate phosphatase [hydrocarbon metagenome]|uniref:Phosphoglycolate phosphatase n=1 Tax=hydrocarbon metagenome TaxID=938273 RepID=A0A0W8E533_9ZZZZ
MVKKYKLVIFDLDGTLTDSAEGIVNSVQYALAKLGIVEDDRYKLRAFIGPPLMDSFQKNYDLSSQQAWQAVQYYREYFAVNGMFENKVYDGIPSLLNRLQNYGRLMAVATSKPGVYAEQILDHFNLLKYFDLVVGSNLDGSMTDKAQIIALVLKSFEYLPLDEMIMVGDRTHDVEGAQANGIDVVAVTYGYASEEEFLCSRPSYLVDTVYELEKLLG